MERLLYSPGEYMCFTRWASWQMASTGKPYVKVLMNVRWNIQMRNGAEKYFPETSYRDRTAFVFLELDVDCKERNLLAVMELGWKGRRMETLGPDVSKGSWVRANCSHNQDEKGVTRERWRIRIFGSGFKQADEDDPAAMDEAAKYLKLDGDQ